MKEDRRDPKWAILNFLETRIKNPQYPTVGLVQTIHPLGGAVVSK